MNILYYPNIHNYNVTFIIVFIIHRTAHPESLRILQFNFLLNNIPWNYIKLTENIEVLPGDYYYYTPSDD